MLKGINIYLRPLEPEDLNLLYIWENDPSIWHLSNTLIPFSKYTLENYITQAQQDIFTSKQLRLIICLNNGRSIGCIDLFDFDPYNSRAGIGILISEPADRGNGHATEALKLLVNYSFNLLHLNQLFCNILEDNLPSLNLFKQQFFVVTGEKKQWIKKHGQFLNEYMLQLINPSNKQA